MKGQTIAILLIIALFTACDRQNDLPDNTCECLEAYRLKYEELSKLSNQADLYLAGEKASYAESIERMKDVAARLDALDAHCTKVLDAGGETCDAPLTNSSYWMSYAAFGSVDEETELEYISKRYSGNWAEDSAKNHRPPLGPDSPETRYFRAIYKRDIEDQPLTEEEQALVDSIESPKPVH